MCRDGTRISMWLCTLSGIYVWNVVARGRGRGGGRRRGRRGGREKDVMYICYHEKRERKE